MANGATALYISETSIRLMVTRGRRITKLADVPLEAAQSEATPEEREAELAAKIKDLFKRNRIGSRKVILGISGLHCLTRPLTLPDLPRAMLDEAVIREARRVLPVPPEQLYISWQALSAVEGKMQAFMVAIPKYIADTVLGALGQAGFKPWLMDIKPLALARLARVPTAVIVDVQPGEFDIVIMVNGLPQPVRTLPFPRESTSLEERMQTVSDELARTVQFHNSNSPEHALQPGTPLLVSGELADEPEMYESLADPLGLEAALLASPLKCPKHLEPSHHLVNVGLAMKQLKENGPLLPNFNTLPAHYQPKQLSLNRIMAIPMTATAGALLVVLALNIQGASAGLEDIRLQLDQTNMLMERRQAERQELEGQITAAQQQLAALQSQGQAFSLILGDLVAKGDLMNDDLNASVDNVVSDLDLANIGHTGAGLTIKGQASSEVEVMEYVRKLTATGRFSEITIATLNRIEGSSDNTSSMMDFYLNLQLEGTEP